MTIAVGKCGCLCDICPLYKENLLTIEDKKQTSEGCSKYLNWTPTPEKLKQCWGCQSEEGFKYITNCNMRMCAIFNKIENCAYCSAFPCENVQSFSREQVEERIGEPVTEEDYSLFIKPWEGAKNLEIIRKTLSEDEIVKMKTYSVDLRIVDVPEDLDLPKENLDAYRKIHNLIKTIEPLKNLSYARAKVRKKERYYLVKLLWTIGIKGKILHETDNDYIELASIDYFNEMKDTIFYSNWKVFQKRLEIFKKKGIKIEINPEIDLESILTPTMGLRKKGWALKISFDKRLNRSLGIEAHNKYSKKLFKKYGNKGFRYFTRADMRILI